MKKSKTPHSALRTPAITSADALDARVADLIKLKLSHKALICELDLAKAALDKQCAATSGEMLARIAAEETVIHEYCAANRRELFPEKKSRETNAAVIGFELTPFRVERSSTKIKWADVLARLLRLKWGLAYTRQPEPVVDKNALLADREKLTPEQLQAAGIRFEQDEQFFIRPKSEVVEQVTQETA